jgi:putative membrane protein
MTASVRAVLSAWEVSPVLVGGRVLLAGRYAGGGWRSRQRPGGRVVVPGWRGGCFGGGLLALVLALLSPLAAYDDRYFWVHMVQHLLLLVVAPPLLWLGLPLVTLLWVLPAGARHAPGHRLAHWRWRRRLVGVLTHPLVALLLYLAMVALWHLPPWYDRAQGQSALHETEHALFLGTALLYWWPVVPRPGSRQRLHDGADLLYLMIAGVEGGVLGGVLTFAAQPLYATYQQAPQLGGLSVVLDQQLGGIAMWLGGGLVYAGWVFVSFVRMVQREERAWAQRLPGVRVRTPGLIGLLATFRRSWHGVCICSDKSANDLGLRPSAGPPGPSPPPARPVLRIMRRTGYSAAPPVSPSHQLASTARPSSPSPARTQV